ncbi:MAG TPA: acylglycerol kinase family protein [Geminicoccaceae bacterium]|nr:acylglycerol kinase family protein [Geminicoccaceae bacterium]
MSRVGIVSNPGSRRNRARLGEIRAVLERYPETLHAEAAQVADLESILCEFARREVDLVVVNGGDGTVHATLTALCNGTAYRNLPALAVLPTGMTNLIALDVGLAGRPETSLARLLDRLASGGEVAQERRPLLSLSTGGNRPPLHGMFFGTAAFHQAVRMARNEVHPTGARGSLAFAMSLTLAIWRALAGRSDRPGPLFQGQDMTIDLDGVRQAGERYFLVLATTLRRLIFGLMPFWGDGSGQIRYTGIAFPPVQLMCALLPVLRGRPRPWMSEPCYVSRTVDDITIATGDPLVIDGEFVQPEPDVPVLLRSDREALFVRC